MADDETNQLLREIRDILAAQENKYEKHLADVRAMYAEQIKDNEEQRKRSVRMLFAWVMVLVGLLAISVKWWMS